MNAFLQKYKIPTNPLELYRQFMFVWKEVNESTSSFNDRFHWAYTRLQALYVLNDVAALPIYYETLDNLTATLVRRMWLAPTRLVDAYAEAVIANTDLG